MNKWYFYKNNSVSDAMDFETAKKFAIANPDAYGWKPSYTQWLPLQCISDFADIIPKLEPLADIPKEIVDEFNNKANSLVKNLAGVKINISNGEIISQKFAQEIESYKEITQTLSPDVQANINHIEQEYNALHQMLSTIKENTHLTANEINKVVNDFNLSIADKTVISSTPAPQKKTSNQKEKTTDLVKPEKAIIATSKSTAKVPEKKLPKNAIETETRKAPTKTTTKAAEVKLPEQEIKAEANKTTTKTATTKAAEEKLPEQTVENSINDKIVNIRPQRPEGAKVISTRSSKPSTAKIIAASNIKTEQKDKVTTESKESVNIEPIQLKGVPSAEADKAQSSALQADKIKDKIGSSVKNIFSSMFSTESSSPSISAGLKDLASKQEEQEEEENAMAAENEELTTKRKRRRRR